MLERLLMRGSIALRKAVLSAADSLARIFSIAVMSSSPTHPSSRRLTRRIFSDVGMPRMTLPPWSAIQDRISESDLRCSVSVMVLLSGSTMNGYARLLVPHADTERAAGVAV